MVNVHVHLKRMCILLLDGMFSLYLFIIIIFKIYLFLIFLYLFNLVALVSAAVCVLLS